MARYAIFEFLVYVSLPAAAAAVVAVWFCFIYSTKCCSKFAALPHCRCRPASSGNRVINAWNFHNRNEFPAPAPAPAPAASQARKHARSSLTISPRPTPPAFPSYSEPSCRDLATPLVVAALITNASRWPRVKSSWPSCAKQTKTSLVQELQQRERERAKGRGSELAGRQQQSYGKTSTRLARTGEAFNCTSADRIRVGVGVRVRVKRSVVLADTGMAKLAN